MTTNLGSATSLQDITFDLKLSWASLCDMNSHLRALVRQAIAHRPRNLASLCITLQGYITISTLRCNSLKQVDGEATENKPAL